MDLNELPKIAKISLKMPKLLETVTLSLFETYNEISGIADFCPKKIKTEKLLTFNFSTFFFNVAHFEWFSRAKIRLILTSFWHASNIFVKIFGVILEFLQNSYNLFRAKMILLTVNLFTYTERVHNSLTITLLSHLWSFSLRICACFQAPTMPTGLRTLGAFNCKKLNFE